MTLRWTLQDKYRDLGSRKYTPLPLPPVCSQDSVLSLCSPLNLKSLYLSGLLSDSREATAAARLLFIECLLGFRYELTRFAVNYLFNAHTVQGGRLLLSHFTDGDTEAEH